MKTGRWTRLRNVSPNDYPYLYEAEINARIRGSSRVPAPHIYPEVLWNNVLTQFVVVRNDEAATPVGLVSAYNADSDNGHCYVLGFSIFNEPFRRALLADGIATMFSHLFSNWPFRKIYVQTRGSALIPAARLGLMREEARLSDHFYVDGQYDDLVICSLDRDHWEAYERHYFRRFQDGDPRSVPD